MNAKRARTTARKIITAPWQAALWADRVLWGKPLGRLIILAVLLSGGVPALQAVPASEILNKSLDALIQADTAIAAEPAQ